MINQWCITSKFWLVWTLFQSKAKLWDLNLFWCIDSWIWPIIIIWNLCIVSSICDSKQSIPARASFSFGSAVQLAYSVILKFFVLVFFLWNIIFFFKSWMLPFICGDDYMLQLPCLEYFRGDTSVYEVTQTRNEAHWFRRILNWDKFSILLDDLTVAGILRFYFVNLQRRRRNSWSSST